MSETLQQIDVGSVTFDAEADWARVLDEQLQSVLAAGGRERPWLFWEWHNPWSRASACLDSWTVLDLCSAPALLQAVAEAIGSDIVLFDSQLVPNPALPWQQEPDTRNDPTYFPLEGGACGVVTSLPVCDRASGYELLVRYFPADRQYSRDPSHPAHVLLTERYPWVNYRTMPLWLVAGEDRADNDFVTGFNPKAGRWTTAERARSTGRKD